MSLTNQAEACAAEALVGKTTWTAQAVYVGLLSAAPVEGGGGTELSGNGYARVATTGPDWNAYASDQLTNANALAFPQATANWTDSVAVGLFENPIGSSPDMLLAWDYLGAHDWQPFIGETDDTIRCPGHGFSADHRVAVTAEFGGTLPTGLAEGTLYYVLSANLATDTFTISATSGGAAVNITAIGSGMLRRVEPKTIQNNDTASFAAGDLAIKVR